MVRIPSQMRLKAALLGLAICFGCSLGVINAKAAVNFSSAEMKEILGAEQEFVYLSPAAKNLFTSVAALVKDKGTSVGLKSVVSRIGSGKNIISYKEATDALAELPKILAQHQSIFTSEQVATINSNASSVLKSADVSYVATQDGKSKRVLVCKDDCFKQMTNCGTIVNADVIAPDKGSGTICVDGDAAVEPSHKLLTNEINPVKLNENGCCVEDDNGTTCFSGNVGFSKDLAISPEGELLVGNLSPVKGNECGEFEKDSDGHICVHGDLAIDGDCCPEESHRLLVNRIGAVKHDQDGECVANPGGTVCFENNVAIIGEQGALRKLLVNEIDPVKLDGHCCVENDAPDAQICVSGNLVIQPDHGLYVKKICGVCDPCTPSDTACVEICNLKFNGPMCFDQDISITGGHKLLVNEIDPEDHCYPGTGCIRFSGDISLQNNKLLVNEINPVDKYDACTPDDDGITCFSGNVGVNPGTCEHKHKLLVNWIDPVKVNEDGICVEDHGKKAATCFSGDVAIEPGRKLLVNEINPVETGQCECNPNDDGVTCFSGNVAIPGDCGGHELRVNNIVPAKDCERNSCGTVCFDGTVAITPFAGECTHKLLVNEIDPVKIVGDCCVPHEYGCTQFSGNVSIPHKKLLVNFIDPVHPNDPCEADDDGVTCFSGNVAIPGDCKDGHELRVNNIVPAKGCAKNPCGTICLEGIVAIKPTPCSKLLVNEIDPVKDCCEECDGGTTCFSGNVVMNKGLCVAGEILASDGECGCLEVGRICVGSTLAIAGDCQNPNHTEPELRVNTIVPVIPDGADKCERNDCGIICVDGTLAISPKPYNVEDSCESECQHRLLVNKIDPVQINPYTHCCEANPDGLTCFSGNVVIDADKTLYVKRICASKDCCSPDEGGIVNIECPVCFDTIRARVELLTNHIDPVNPYTCEKDENGTTCFSGDVAVTGYRCEPNIDCDGNCEPASLPSKKLFVNQICPVQNGCEPDETGTVTFCGNVAIPGECGHEDAHKLLVNFINPVTIKDGCPLEDCDGVTCFSGNVGVRDGKAIRTNKITPTLCDTECCECDPNGCINIDGHLCISDPKTLRIGIPNANSGGRLHLWGQQDFSGVVADATATATTINFANSPSSPTGAFVKLVLVGNRPGKDDIIYEGEYIITPSGGVVVSEVTRKSDGTSYPNDGDNNIAASFNVVGDSVEIKLTNNNTGVQSLNSSVFYEVIAEDAISVS